MFLGRVWHGYSSAGEREKNMTTEIDTTLHFTMLRRSSWSGDGHKLYTIHKQITGIRFPGRGHLPVVGLAHRGCNVFGWRQREQPKALKGSTFLANCFLLVKLRQVEHRRTPD